MTIEHETTAASENDSWSAYTYAKLSDGSEYEIRHPRPPLSQTFSIWAWSDIRGTYVVLGGIESLEDALFELEQPRFLVNVDG